ncbi:unnamed protein product [Caenorhabditis angaria]|uniref:Uncharacterized protein n=1 Tax=Caenorhabditis angaria TaxID=860376 RepID=A0A9P1NA13_9PELO|nr:unnamed protein product [Caenorhabditis angaria]
MLENETFEEFPKWYQISMHISASITIPINIFGLIMIAFFSKAQMKNYRYYLLFHQICSMLSDIIINTGTLPVIYSPYAIGTPYGWMSWVFKLVLGVENSTWLQAEIAFFGILMAALSVELLFFYRYQVILPLNHPWKLAKFSKFLSIFIYQLIWVFLVSISFHYTVSKEQTGVKNQFRKAHPDLAFFVQNQNSLIVATDVNLNVFLFLCFCFIRLGSGAILCWILIILSRHALDNMVISAKTRNMHLTLIRHLCYQVSVPLSAFYIPILVLISPLVFEIHNTFYSGLISLNIVSYHTFFGTFSLLYFNRPWKFRNIFTKKKYSAKLEILNTSNSWRR